MDMLKGEVKHHGRIALLIAIVLIGLCVRCLAFGDLPYGLNQDEASMAYDAYADMTYGMDRNGDHLPIYAVAWGSGQNMGYNYLVRPFIAVLGLTPLAVRLPMLLLNCLSLLAFYGFANACFGQKTALWAVFLLAICPWHIMLSRWALESNLAVPLIIFAAYCFAKAPKRHVFFALGMAFSALCMYAYSATIFFLALFVPTMVVTALVQRLVPKRWIFVGCAVFVLLALPLAAFFVVNLFKLPACHFLGFAIPRLSEMRSNATTVFFGSTPPLHAFAKNLLNLLNLLVRMDDGRISNAIPYIGAIYLVLLPFIAIGSVRVLLRLKKESRSVLIPLAWLCAALAQALVVVVNINRINVLFPVLVLCAAVGVQWVAERIKAVRVVVVVVCMVFFGVFCGYYFQSYAKDSAKAFYPGLDTAIAYAAEHAAGEVYYTDTMNATYIYSLYGQKTDPKVFLNTVEYDSASAPFRYVYRYDRFVTGIPAEPQVQTGQAYVLQVDEAVPAALETTGNERKTFGNYEVIIVH